MNDCTHGMQSLHKAYLSDDILYYNVNECDCETGVVDIVILRHIEIIPIWAVVLAIWEFDITYVMTHELVFLKTIAIH